MMTMRMMRDDDDDDYDDDDEEAIIIDLSTASRLRRCRQLCMTVIYIHMSKTEEFWHVCMGLYV